MFAQIIPLRKLPKSIDYFDYKVPKKLSKKIKIGQVVLIPFRRQKIKGIVINFKKTSNFKKVRAILNIIIDKPVINKNQIKLAKFISQYYFVSLSLIIKKIIPPLLKRPRPASKKGAEIKYKKIKKTKLDISSSIKNKKALFEYKQMEEKYKLYLNLIKEDKNQTLIVFPQIPDIYNFYQYLNKTWRKKTAIINHQLSDSQLYHIYEKVAQGKIKVILGTSLAFFLPYKNLKTVVIDEEDNKNHKQYDQNPRFHNKIVAEKIFSLYKTRLILTSACPNITTYFQAKKGRYKLYKSKEKAKPKSTLVDLTRSNRGGKSFLSIFLKNEIENKLNDKKKILLLNNRKGFSRTSVCRDCGYTANCPDCQIPLTQHKKSSGYYLLCHRCGFQRKMILKCPNCGSAEISSLGLGQEKIFEEISNLFPKVKITKISSQSETSQYLKKSEIVISTFIALSRFIKNKFGLIVLVNADQILNLPDYRSSEKTFQLLFNLNCLARYNQADFIIQTYSAKNSSFKYFPNRYENFFRQELKNRKLLNYPPYSQLIKLSSQAQSPYQAKKEALDIHHKISNKFSSLSLSPPLPAFRLKRFDRYFYNIILKLPKNIKHKKLQSIIKLVPDHWLIDRNPENLL